MALVAERKKRLKFLLLMQAMDAQYEQDISLLLSLSTMRRSSAIFRRRCKNFRILSVSL